MRDFVTALVHAREDRAAQVDRIKHSAAKYMALGHAFGLRTEELPPIDGEDEYSGDDLAGLFESTLKSLERLRSPFASYLEAPESLSRLYRHHGPRIENSLCAARLPLLELLVDLVTLRWGLPPATHVTGDDLRNYGFDPDVPEPDPVDYL